MKNSKDKELKDMSDDLIGVNEVAELLHLSKQTIYNWMTKGKLKRSKIGGKAFVDRLEVKKLLKNAKDGFR